MAPQAWKSASIKMFVQFGPFNGKRCDGSTLRNAMKIGPPVVLEEGRQSDGRGVGI